MCHSRCANVIENNSFILLDLMFCVKNIFKLTAMLPFLLACDCHPVGTTLGNVTMCDQVTGQCVCNTTAKIGGIRCDRCMENSWNTSASLFSCTGKCDESSVINSLL